MDTRINFLDEMLQREANLKNAIIIATIGGLVVGAGVVIIYQWNKNSKNRKNGVNNFQTFTGNQFKANN